MDIQEMYNTIPDFRDYVHRFIEWQARNDNYITVSQALTYAIVGEYAACMRIHLNLK